MYIYICIMCVYIYISYRIKKYISYTIYNQQYTYIICIIYILYNMTHNWDASSQWCPHQPPVVKASSAARHSEVGAMVAGQQTLLQQLWHCGTAKPGLENFHGIISRNNHYEKNSFWWYIYNLSSVNYLSIGTTGKMVNVRSSECHFKSVYIYIYIFIFQKLVFNTNRNNVVVDYWSKLSVGGKKDIFYLLSAP